MRVRFYDTTTEESRELSRRRFLKGAGAGAGALALLALLAACGNSQTNAPTDPLKAKFNRIKIDPQSGEWLVPNDILEANPPQISIPTYHDRSATVFKAIAPRQGFTTSDKRYSINSQIFGAWIGGNVGGANIDGIATLFQYAVDKVLDNNDLGLTNAQKQSALSKVSIVETALTVYTERTTSGRYGPVPADLIQILEAEPNHPGLTILRQAISSGNYNDMFSRSINYPPNEGSILTGGDNTGRTQFFEDPHTNDPKAFFGVVDHFGNMMLMNQIFGDLITPQRQLEGLIVNELATLPAVGVEVMAPEALEAFRARHNYADTLAAREALTTIAHMDYLQGK